MLELMSDVFTLLFHILDNSRKQLDVNMGGVPAVLTDKIKPNTGLRRGRQVWRRGTLPTVGELASQKVGIGQGKLQAKFLVLPVVSFQFRENAHKFPDG